MMAMIDDTSGHYSVMTIKVHDYLRVPPVLLRHISHISTAIIVVALARNIPTAPGVK